jgi:PAS domain S-box-containing protein
VLSQNYDFNSPQLFNSFFENSPVGLAIVATDHRFLLVNRSFTQITKYSYSELLSKKFDDITHPKDLKSDEEDVQRCLIGEIDGYEMLKRYITKDDMSVWVNLSVRAVRRRDDGEIDFFYVTAVPQKVIHDGKTSSPVYEESNSDMICKNTSDSKIIRWISSNFLNLFTSLALLLGWFWTFAQNEKDDENVRNQVQEMRRWKDETNDSFRKLLEEISRKKDEKD